MWHVLSTLATVLNTFTVFKSENISGRNASSYNSPPPIIEKGLQSPSVPKGDQQPADPWVRWTSAWQSDSQPRMATMLRRT